MSAARIRAIKPDFFVEEDLAEVSALARLLFIGLWTIADRAGRLEDRPRRIKAQLLPYDDVNVDELLDELASHAERFIIRYVVDGQPLIQVRSFGKHQRPNVREPDSTISPPNNSDTDAHVRARASTLGREGKGREGNGEGSTAGEPSDPAPSPSHDQADDEVERVPQPRPEDGVVEVIVRGGKHSTAWVRSEWLDQLRGEYPSVDPLEVAKTLARKVRTKAYSPPPTERGLRKTLASWCETEHRGGQSRSPPRATQQEFTELDLQYFQDNPDRDPRRQQEAR